MQRIYCVSVNFVTFTFKALENADLLYQMPIIKLIIIVMRLDNLAYP